MIITYMTTSYISIIQQHQQFNAYLRASSLSISYHITYQIRETETIPQPIFPSSTGALPNHLSTSSQGLNTSKNRFYHTKPSSKLSKITNQAPIFTYTQPKPQSSYPYTTSQCPNLIEQQITLGLRILPHPRSKETRLTFSFKRVGSYNIKEPKISTFHP